MLSPPPSTAAAGWMLGELPWKPGSFGMRLSILTGWDGAGGALQWGAEGCSPKLSRDSGSGAPCKQGGKAIPRLAHWVLLPAH